uniref:LEM domain-containing protein n=1 Tax=Panagrolaimus sp. PS1159 TaxID=55785 RepID=A0AC35GSI8_9BILA
MSNIYDELSNEELREELLQRGFPNAPITSGTRKVYIRKLMNLTASGDADFNIYYIEKLRILFIEVFLAFISKFKTFITKD